MAGRLDGKVAVVTGAASIGPGLGIGKAISILFAREGAKVVLVNRSQAHAMELQKEIEAESGDCLAFAADVTKPDQVQQVVDAAMERYGRLDILCNNVGVGGAGSVVNLKEDVWDNAMNVNLKGAMWCCKHAIPRMIEGGGGSIINISTVAAVQGFHRDEMGFAAYSASKAGLLGLTRAMAADHAAAGIRVNSLLVGMVHTPRLESLGEESRQKRRLAVPLKTEGTGWDVAWAAVYLASNESRWVTGALIPVDGGQMSLREWPG